MAEQTLSLAELVSQLPPELQQEVYDFAEFLLSTRVKKPARKYLSLSWAGALSEFRDQCTSLELQEEGAGVAR